MVQEIAMHTIRNLILLVAIAASSSLAGCTFRPYVRRPTDPTVVIGPTCRRGQGTGTPCAVAYDSGGFLWVGETMQSARR
jgi:hypothetical protein